MKTPRSILLALTVLLLATAAQAQTTNVKASIPFDFVVGDHAYSAGEYTVKSIAIDSPAIRVDNADESEKGITLSDACSSGRPATGTKLVFQRLGNNYFLYQIWTEGNSSGREFRMSKTQVQLAKNYGKPEFVMVAANISQQPPGTPAVLSPKEGTSPQPFPLFYLGLFILQCKTGLEHLVERSATNKSAPSHSQMRPEDGLSEHSISHSEIRV